MSKFMEIRPVRAALLHADGRTERHDEANRLLFRDLCEDALNRVSAFLLYSCLVHLDLFNINTNVSLFSSSVVPIT